MFCEMQRLHGLDLVEEGYRWNEVAMITGWSEYSLSSWHACYMESGSVWQNPALRNRHDDAAVRNEDLRDAILTLVEAE